MIFGCAREERGGPIFRGRRAFGGWREGWIGGRGGKEVEFDGYPHSRHGCMGNGALIVSRHFEGS